MSVLNAAHAMGVVHRDLKPENIMIGKATTGGEPVVKLLDLGIAKLREVAGAEKTGSTNLTVAGQMLGTPYYMSPEQWGELPHDGNSEIDGRADIYSLGCVFYEIIAAKRPFDGMTLAELRRQHVSITPAPLHEVAAGVPAWFQPCDRALDSQGSSRTAGHGRPGRTGTGRGPVRSGISATPSLSELCHRSRPAAFQPGVITSPHQTAATMVTGAGSICFRPAEPGGDHADGNRATKAPSQPTDRERHRHAFATATRKRIAYARGGCSRAAEKEFGAAHRRSGSGGAAADCRRWRVSS
mgnify:CR=1 FL=1